MHEKLPLDEGGTSAQPNAVGDLAVGASRTVDWPVPRGIVYPPLRSGPSDMEIIMDLASTLAAVQADQKAAGGRVRPGASEASIEATRTALAAKCGAPLPDELAALWRLTDGLDWNGMVLYGTVTAPDGRFWQSIVAANEEWRGDPGNEPLLIVGDTDLDILAMELATGLWLSAGRIGRDRRFNWDRLDRLVAETLSTRL